MKFENHAQYKRQFYPKRIFDFALIFLDKLDFDVINFSVNVDAENASGLHIIKIINAAKTLQDLDPVKNSNIKFEK